MAKKSQASVDVVVIVEDPAWGEVVDQCTPDQWFAAALGQISHEYSQIEVSLVFANDAQVQELNKRYRNKDKPTNVLSFPVPHNFFTPGKGPVNLGDIVLGYETIVGETMRDKKTLLNHVTHLCVHGFFHLLGFDHENEIDATKMERLEVQTLKQFDIPNPYA